MHIQMRKWGVPSFVIAFDDSGGVEPLCDWSGRPIKGDHPITALTGAFVDRASESEFNERWNALRESIGLELGQAPPPIHMRLMWGRTLPGKYRGSPNPYLKADFGSIKRWISEALEIYREFAERKLMGAVSFNRSRSMYQPSLQRYFEDERFKAEHAYIRKQVRGAYRGYHNSIVSPLVPLYTLLIPHVNELVHVVRGEYVDVLLDSFADAHGIDAEEVVNEMKRVAGLQHIGSVSRISDGDGYPLVQAADLIGFLMFRTQMGRDGHIAPDPIVEGLLTPPLPMVMLTRANINHIVRRKFPDLMQITLTMEYALARSRLHAKAPTFVVEQMISVDEFLDRAKVAASAEDVGISVLKNPEMAKTPD